MKKTIGWFFNILMVVISVGLGLYLTEAWLAYEEWQIELGTGERVKRAAEDAGADWDPRSKVEFIRDLRAEGVDAFPAMAPTVYVDSNGIDYKGDKIFLFSGISGTRQVFCQEMGFWSNYDADEHGFNNPKGLYEPGKLDVALVGDSFTHGACVKQGDDMAGQLRDKGWRALNVGIGGSGPLTYLAVQREYVKPVKPKVVFWMFYAVDIRDSVYEKESAILSHYLEDPDFSQNLINRQDEIDTFLRDFLNTSYQKKLDDLTAARQTRREVITKRLIHQGLRLTKLRERLRNLGGRDVVTEGREEEKLDLLRRILGRAKAEVEGWGGQMVFVYLPDWYTYAKDYDTYGIKIDDNFLLRQDVLKEVKDIGLPIIDIQGDVFDKHPDPVSLYNWRMYGHYNTEGYKLVTEQLENYLEEHLSRQQGSSGS